jgi:deoxyribonuclease V
MGPFPPPDTTGRGFSFAGSSLRVREVHGFDLAPAEARRLQEELAGCVEEGPPLEVGRVRHVAGADVSTQDGVAYATVAVLDFPGLSVVEVRGFEAPLRFPYIPGLLAFREVPAVIGALRAVETPVDALICDAQGRAHPRRMGLACHVGLFVDGPTVGCAKSRLVGGFREPGEEKGSVSDLVHAGEVVGRVVRTRRRVSPVFVSVGNRIDLDSAVELVLACCSRYRLPEPTRQAHNAANRLRREGQMGLL